VFVEGGGEVPVPWHNDTMASPSLRQTDDGRTDGRTDGRRHIANVNMFTFANKFGLK